ncbi:MAG TPA: hypothetical protein VLU41_16170 [Ideonella sp.]|nr:hypothetical protein [Ideonella sp.]
MRAAAVIALAGLIAAAPCEAAGPSQVYRCGQTYQQTPCSEGRAVEVDDARSEAQRRDAQATARDQARLGGALERERLTRQKATPPTAAVGIGGRPVADAASAAKKTPRHGKKKAKAADSKNEDFVAIEPLRPRPARAADAR